MEPEPVYKTDNPDPPATRVDAVVIDIIMAVRGIKSYAELAKLAKKNRNTIENARAGRVVDTETLNALAVALGCNPKDLLATPGHPAPQTWYKS